MDFCVKIQMTEQQTRLSLKHSNTLCTLLKMVKISCSHSKKLHVHHAPELGTHEPPYV